MDEFEKYYNWLKDYQQKKDAFWVSDWGCGMVRYRSNDWGNKGLILADKEARRAYPIVYPDGTVTMFTLEDVAPAWRDKIPIKDGYMLVRYRMEVERFVDSVARVSWMIRPDGSYYADEDGFGRTDDEEVNLYATIDKQCRVLVLFQPRTE